MLISPIPLIRRVFDWTLWFYLICISIFIKVCSMDFFSKICRNSIATYMSEFKLNFFKYWWWSEIIFEVAFEFRVILFYLISVRWLDRYYLGKSLEYNDLYATSKHFRPKCDIRGNQKLHGRDNLMNDINTNDFAYPTHIIIFHCFLRLGFFHRTQIG